MWALSALTRFIDGRFLSVNVKTTAEDDFWQENFQQISWKNNNRGSVKICFCFFDLGIDIFVAFKTNYFNRLKGKSSDPPPAKSHFRGHGQRTEKERKGRRLLCLLSIFLFSKTFNSFFFNCATRCRLAAWGDEHYCCRSPPLVWETPGPTRCPVPMRGEPVCDSYFWRLFILPFYLKDSNFLFFCNIFFINLIQSTTCITLSNISLY